MRSFSIYRGQAEEGIGEGPGLTVPRGEQYLRADEELWKSGPDDLPKTIRAWMTLDSRAEEEQRLGDRMESWSCFRTGDLWFVARLALAGVYDRRIAYVSHGRAWRETEFESEPQPGFDPGALLGRADAFAPLASGYPLSGAFKQVQPEMIWQDLVRSERKTATALLSALYQACQGGPPVAWAIPAADFVEGSPIHGLVAFARAALPFELKRDCRLRVYTSSPQRFLSILKAHLIVIPETLSSEALAAKPQPVLLDRAGAVHFGTIADDLYARSIVSRAIEYPDGLLEFGKRVSEKVRPGERDKFASTVYNVIVASRDTAQMDDLLRFLYKKSTERQEPQPWDRLIARPEWEACTVETLGELALAEAPTEDAGRLRREIRKALHDVKKSNLDGAVGPHLDSTASSRRGAEILSLFDQQLISKTAAARHLAGLTAPDAAAMLTVDNAEQAGALLAGQPAPEDWVVLWPRDGSAQEDAQRLLRLVRSLEQAAGTRLPDWRSLLQPALQRLLEERADPRPLKADLASMAVTGNFEDDLMIVELLYRSDASVDRQLAAILTETDRERRRMLFRHAQTGSWNCLQRVAFPATWDQDLADLYPQSQRALENLQPDRVRSLVGLVKEMSPALALRIDAIFGSDSNPARPNSNSVQLARELEQAGLWLPWRLQSQLDSRRKDCAFAYLLSLRQTRRPGDAPLFEDWKQAMEDAGTLDLSGLQLLFSQQADFASMWIPMLQFEQYQDLARACGERLDVRAELSRLLNTSSASLFEESAVADIPPDLADYLTDYPPKAPLSLQHAIHLYKHSGSKQEKARKLVADAWMTELLSLQPAERLLNEAADLAGLLKGPWGLIGRIEPKLKSQGIPPAGLDFLENCLPPETSLPQSEPTSRLYASKGYPNIARLYWVRKTPLPDRVIIALREGDAHSPVWTEWRFETNRDLQTLEAVIDRVTGLQTDLNARLELQTNGWTVVRAVSQRKPRTMLQEHLGCVPALALAAALRSGESLAVMGIDFFKLIGHGGEQWRASWWQRFFKTLQKSHKLAVRAPMRDDFEQVCMRIHHAVRTQDGHTDWYREAYLTAIEEALHVKPLRQLKRPMAGSLAKGAGR